MAKIDATEQNIKTEECTESGNLSPWPSTTRGKLILGYFTGFTLLVYLLIDTVGPMTMKIIGFPVLFWLTTLIYIMFAGGMYVLVYKPEARDRDEDR